MTVVTVDEKGRLLIPRREREALGVHAGDTFFVERDGPVLRFAKAPNPFDRLADDALNEYRAGRTRNLRDVQGVRSPEPGQGPGAVGVEQSAASDGR